VIDRMNHASLIAVERCRSFDLVDRHAHAPGLPIDVDDDGLRAIGFGHQNPGTVLACLVFFPAGNEHGRTENLGIARRAERGG
jgi:hypothetical protein